MEADTDNEVVGHRRHCYLASNGDLSKAVNVFVLEEKAAYEVLRSLVGSEMCMRGRREGLGTHYGGSWVRELTWALLPGEEFVAARVPAALADPRGNFEEREPRQF